MASGFTLLFLAALCLATAVRLWLTRRQIACVAAHRDAVPPQFAERISLEAHQKAADYTIVRSRFGQWSTVAEAAVLLALTLGGGIALIFDFWREHLSGLPQGLALIFSVMALSSLVDLPFSWYRQFVIEERFGFNRMTPALFFSDLVKQTLLAAVIGLPVLAAVLWLMAAMGDAWWLYVWVFWSAFNLLILFIYPTWIAPLFNKFTPLEEGEMKQRIEGLLARCGFQSKGLFVMDGSKRSSHGNAYFTGFGDNKRIVFFDTLLSRLTPEQVEAVLAHELGHFRRRHVIKRIALMFGLSLASLWLLGYLMAAPWFYAGLGVPIARPDTALALLLFFLALPVFTFALSPLTSLLSRRHEFEADAYAAEHTAAADLVAALVRLYEDNAATLTPDPLHSLFFDSHPPAALRVAHLNGLSQSTP